jgi:hypothetical protein
VLSCLCVKNSYDVKTNVLSFVKCVYLSDARDNYAGISELTERLIKSFSMYEQQQLFSQFLEFPVISDDVRYKYPDPLSYIEFAKTREKLQIDNKIIENSSMPILTGKTPQALNFPPMYEENILHVLLCSGNMDYWMINQKSALRIYYGQNESKTDSPPIRIITTLPLCGFPILTM